MRHEFEWDSKNKELIETRAGDELVNNKNEKVDGRFINSTIYPELTARSFIKELERQLRESKLQHEDLVKTVKKLEQDISPVSPAFKKQFMSCMASLGVEKQKDSLTNTEKQNVELNKQLAKLKETMGEDF